MIIVVRSLFKNTQQLISSVASDIRQVYFVLISGINYSVPNIPQLFDNECWDSLTKVELQDNNITDQLAGMGINDQPAKYPGKFTYKFIIPC